MKLLWRVGYLTWQNKRLAEENARIRDCNMTLGRQVLWFKDVAERERAERRELSRNLAVLSRPSEWGVCCPGSRPFRVGGTVSETVPQVGERWVSKDKRDGGKTVRVLSVDSAFVYVEGFRQSRVRRENFGKLYRPAS